MKRWLKRLFLGFTAVLIISIIGLEIASRTCDCSNELPPELSQITACTELPGYDPQLTPLLRDIQTQRDQGSAITSKEYAEAMEMFVIEVDQQEIGIMNGVACNRNIAYVTNDLPPQAMLFVKRHEFEHLVQGAGETNLETGANIAAAKQYPVGLLATIFYSLAKLKAYFSWCCFFVLGWINFKVYFLGL